MTAGMHSGSGKEIRFQFGEQPGVNRPVERPTGRLTPTARHELVGRLFVRCGLSPAIFVVLQKPASETRATLLPDTPWRARAWNSSKIRQRGYSQ